MGDIFGYAVQADIHLIGPRCDAIPKTHVGDSTLQYSIDPESRFAIIFSRGIEV